MKHQHRHWPKVLGVSLVVLLILGMAPATLLARWVEDACSGQCRLAEAQGFWWSGEARLFIRPAGNASWMALGPITWWPAIDASAPLQVRLGAGELSLRPGWQGLRGEIRKLTLPAAALLAQPALGLPAARWEGTLTVTQAWFTVGHEGALDSTGQLLWRGAATNLLEDQPLGELEFSWRKADQARQWLTRIAGGRPGHLSLDGNVHFGGEASRRIDVNVELSPANQHVLGKYLSLAGAEAGPGKGRFVLRRTF